MLSIEVPAADIMRLRGDGPGALRHVQNALKAVTIPCSSAAQVRINLLEMLESDGAVRSQLVGEIDWILERMAEGAIPGDGSRPNLPSRAELEIRRARLEREAAPAEPPFTRPAGPPRDAEDAWRQRIVRHEYRHELSDLASGFDTLSRFKYRATERLASLRHGDRAGRCRGALRRRATRPGRAPSKEHRRAESR